MDFSFYYPRAWYEAIITGARGDQESAQKNFAAARQILEARLTKKPEDPRTLAVLALIDAGLGRKDFALEEARRAVVLMPVSRDAYDGVLVLQGLAQVYAWTGASDQAFAVLQEVTKLPGYLSYGYLLVDPVWEPLRSDPRFAELVASLKR